MRMKVIAPKSKALRKKRVCAYVRVSGDSEELENSMDNQIRFFEDYIRRNPDWEMAGMYCDQGISGFCSNREQFQRMLGDAREGRFDLILVKSVSRFARNTETMLAATRELKKLGVGVQFIVQNINTLTQSGELMLTILGAFAQAESEQCSATQRLAIHRKYERGEPGSKTCNTFGYRRGAEGMEIVEEQARVVRMLFDLAGKGVWPTKIRDYLNEQGIPAIGGARWNRTGVVRVLRNPLYKGDLLLQKWYVDALRIRHANNGQMDQYLVEGNHPAIVSAQAWEKAQAMLNQRSEQTKPKKRTAQEPRSSHSRYPLSGLLHCPRCGAKLIHKTAKCGSYWACSTNLKAGKAACNGIWLPEEETKGWNIREPAVPVKYRDEYGMVHFTAYPLSEYEQEAAGNE